LEHVQIKHTAKPQMIQIPIRLKAKNEQEAALFNDQFNRKNSSNLTGKIPCLLEIFV